MNSIMSIANKISKCTKIDVNCLFLMISFLLFFVIGAIIGSILALIGVSSINGGALIIVCGLYLGVIVGIYAGSIYIMRRD